MIKAQKRYVEKMKAKHAAELATAEVQHVNLQHEADERNESLTPGRRDYHWEVCGGELCLVEE